MHFLIFTNLVEIKGIYFVVFLFLFSFFITLLWLYFSFMRPTGRRCAALLPQRARFSHEALVSTPSTTKKGREGAW
jgi:hypothetical protein